MNQYSTEIIDEITNVLANLPNHTIGKVLNLINDADNIFVFGLGRSGFSIRSFGMRLMHLGYQTFAVGETITPSFNSGDLLIVANGTGDAPSIIKMSHMAQQLGGKVLVFGTGQDSPLNRLADSTIQIDTSSTTQPMASLYEQCVLIIGDLIILELMNQSKIQETEMRKRHSNLDCSYLQKPPS